MRFTELKEHATRNILEVITNVEIAPNAYPTDFRDQVEELLDANCYHAPEVIYYCDAWEIVNNMADYGQIDTDGYLDFTGCRDSRDCVSREANAIITVAYENALCSAMAAITERLEEIKDELFKLGFDGELSFHQGSTHGWAAHNYETEDGVMVHKALEGELYAVEHHIGEGWYASACWTPEEQAA